MECACAQTESLRGAAVNAYLTRFLERVNDTADSPTGIYQCRICGTHWLRHSKEEIQCVEPVGIEAGAVVFRQQQFGKPTSIRGSR